MLMRSSSAESRGLLQESQILRSPSLEVRLNLDAVLLQDRHSITSAQIENNGVESMPEVGVYRPV